MAEKKDMTGALFVNTRKKTDRHPDRDGYIVVDGVEYWLSGWIKEKDGKPWMSLAVKRKDAAKQEPREPSESIPF